MKCKGQKNICREDATWEWKSSRCLFHFCDLHHLEMYRYANGHLYSAWTITSMTNKSMEVSEWIPSCGCEASACPCKGGRTTHGGYAPCGQTPTMRHYSPYFEKGLSGIPYCQMCHEWRKEKFGKAGWTFEPIGNQPAVKVLCSCPITILMRSGCQCGGS